MGDMKRRYGRFAIGCKLIEMNPKIICQIMGSCIIVRAEQVFTRNVIEYEALSDWFDKVPLGEEVPEYEVRVLKTGKSTGKWSFMKVEEN